PILVAEGVDHQEVAARLLHLQPLLHYRLWQPRLSALEAVLHVDLRQVRIGAGLEGDVDLGHAVGAAGGFVVQQPLDPVELFLDQAGDRLVENGRRGARIGGVDHDLRRRHVGVLGHRQRWDSQQAGQADEYRHHEGEVGAIDEELRHALSSGLANRVNDGRTHWLRPFAHSPWDGVAITGSTLLPGWKAATPSTMTRSPCSRPDTTRQSLPCILP